MQDYNKEITEIATLRETKGKEKETLEKISVLLPKLIESNQWKSVAKMYWESHLVWQHLVMTELNKTIDVREKKALEEGTEKMVEYAKKAVEIIEKYRIEDMLGGAYRFLGRAATFTGDHLKAKYYYENALNSYSGKNLKSKLEVNGFLAESLIRLGQNGKGLDLAIKTYDDFYNSDIGKGLKKEDYFTWAVWMSGIAPRTAAALLDTGADFDKTRMKAWLIKVEAELTNATETVKWGDPNFEFRLNEIQTVVEKLKR